MMTSGSHTQHVWAVLQYPADPQKGLPVRYRILQSCFDQYTLSAWLDPNPDEERFIRKRDVYAPKNRTLENGGPGYWIKMQRPEKEGGYDFAGYSAKDGFHLIPGSVLQDAFRDLQKAAAQHGQGRLLTAQEMFAKGGYLDNLGSWLQRAHEAATSFPLGMWTQELHDDFINLFGFPVLDFYPGVPYIGQFGVMRKLYESGSPWNLARGSQAKESAESSPKLHGLLVKSAIVTQDCAENFNGLQHSLGGLNPPEYGLDPSLGPATAEWVCGSELQK
ncbi:unnamed protein product [Symbiodinium pilosum]|uniref:Uncharacterized protein n=1 Tax=Symbiodinium pilosum TaxID=2952 RepID=A0A812VDG3_SYMPI|nr:unnamed protein product [Symbiodinium pilosum]